MHALFGAEPTVRYWRPKCHTDHTRETHGMTQSCIFGPIALALTEARPWLSCWWLLTTGADLPTMVACSRERLEWQRCRGKDRRLATADEGACYGGDRC